MNKLTVKKYYTTGDMARFCEVDVNTVKRWIRDGNLKAFSTPSGHFRIARESFVNFLIKQGFIDDMLVQEKTTATAPFLAVDSDPSGLARIIDTLETAANGRTVLASNSIFDGFMKVERYSPAAVFLGFSSTRESNLEFIEALRESRSHTKIDIYAVVGEQDPVVERKLKQLNVQPIQLKTIDKQFIKKIV